MTERTYLNRARSFAKESKRLRRESALTIMFTATILWRSRSSMRAAEAALKGASGHGEEHLRCLRTTSGPG
jgi:hypothetical protein